MKARLVIACGCDPCAEFPEGVMPVGTVIDETHLPPERQECFRLVRRGCAEPADAECAEKANMTAAQWKRAVEHYEMVNAGVLPEDYPAWQKGLMRGYNPDGSWKPGPNAVDDDMMSSTDTFSFDDAEEDDEWN